MVVEAVAHLKELQAVDATVVPDQQAGVTAALHQVEEEVHRKVIPVDVNKSFKNGNPSCECRTDFFILRHVLWSIPFSTAISKYC